MNVGRGIVGVEVHGPGQGIACHAIVFLLLAEKAA